MHFMRITTKICGEIVYVKFNTHELYFNVISPAAPLPRRHRGPVHTNPAIVFARLLSPRDLLAGGHNGRITARARSRHLRTAETGADRRDRGGGGGRGGPELALRVPGQLSGGGEIDGPRFMMNIRFRYGSGIRSQDQILVLNCLYRTVNLYFDRFNIVPDENSIFFCHTVGICKLIYHSFITED